MKSESKKKKNKQPTIYILDLSLFVKYFSNHYLCFFHIFLYFHVFVFNQDNTNNLYVSWII